MALDTAKKVLPKELLVVTTLYPNSEQTRHGIFVETRLRQLLETGEFKATVVAPVPWFPNLPWLKSRYSVFAKVPRRETRHGIIIHHPRYLTIPKVGMLLAPVLLAISLRLHIRSLQKQGLKFELVDTHYYYPDGVAVALIQRWLQKPFTVTARGTDINLIPKYSLPKKMILWAADKAAASITVCQALKDTMVELGADEQKIHTLRNGVNLELFQVLDRQQCRDKLKVQGRVIISVGHLIERKGHHLIIDAMKSLPDTTLLIAGDGELEEQLRNQVQRQGLETQVRFLGALTQDQLVEAYNAADIMVLASSREGWANVLLESMACGTPVAATAIWGTPEVVTCAEAGLLIPERSVDSIAGAVKALFENYPEYRDTRRYAERFSWEATVNALSSLFKKVTN